jgi:hypothetical protein
MGQRRREDHARLSTITRRSFLRYGVLLPSTTPLFLRAAEALAHDLPAASSNTWPEYVIRRERDELFLRVHAVGYAELSGRLVPIRRARDHFLIFSISPQHFAEKALPISEIPPVFGEDKLQSIELLPSAQSKLVFRTPPRKQVALTLEGLLAWHQFELVLPDLDNAGQPYDLEASEFENQPTTRIEMPWGVELSPVPEKMAATQFGFTDPFRLRASGAWSELWTAALVDRRAGRSSGPVGMEVLSVRGFERISTSGSVDQGNLVVSYQNHNAQAFPTESTPLSDYDRIDIASSLSRRFPYTGQVGPPPIESALISYPQENNACVSACFAPGRTVAASQFRISARGGWLQLDGKWDPFPGCALSGWVHSASLGRDNHVEVVSEGFLFPFGTPCELIVISERVFARDEDGHFVAPLIQQAFLQIPQPNSVVIGHSESPFKSVSITTGRSPPLDLPSTGRPDTYREYDFFLPMVKGIPFVFEHVGTDWSDGQHRSAMPMYFVSNKARLANGLIWEPGYSWTSTQANSPCSTPPPASADAAYTIPRNGEGLRVVDRAWSLQPGRFAQYDGALISLAAPGVGKGSTAQKVDWIEWTRANVPDLNPHAIVSPPFRPRARTLRIRIQATEHLSGEPSSSIATYRDTRFTSAPLLDPEPTTPPDEYFLNVTAQIEDPDTAYLYFLETRALLNDSGHVNERAPDQVAADIRDTYYGVSSATNPIPTSLFSAVDNEIRFGRTASAETVGGLAVPDTHVNNLTRKVGPLGDATFNENRWPGYSNVKARLEARNRLDFAAFSRANRSKLDVAPFAPSRTQADRDAAVAAARSIMGFSSPARAPARLAMPSPGLQLGELFGADAQIIPGLRFMDVFQDIALAGAAADPSVPGEASERAAPPLAWSVRLSGIEWLSELLNANTADISIPEVIAAIVKEIPPKSVGEPVSMALESTLDWSNQVFKRVEVGPATFIPTETTKISINARAHVDLGVVEIPANGSDFRFSPGKPRTSARAELSDFSVRIFGAIEIAFSNVAFEISEDGHKSFNTQIANVTLLPPLDFINQIQSMLGGLGGDEGIHIDLSPQRIQISQTLRFPSGDMPLLMGPAEITNLSFSWAVTIPLIGRDVLAVAFGISSREKPLTIYIPPWYGGKAYALLETTTRGCRMVEISMEYGALVPIGWGIATGQASITAGIFYNLTRDDAHDSANVDLRAFVKAAADLSVAGIIQFAGLIYIAMKSESGSGGDAISGVVTVSVSIKLGFIRVSYSFSAAHAEKRRGSDRAMIVRSDVDTPRLGFTNANARRGRPGGFARQVRDNSTVDVLPFGPSFSRAHRAAFHRVLEGYR